MELYKIYLGVILLSFLAYVGYQLFQLGREFGVVDERLRAIRSGVADYYWDPEQRAYLFVYRQAFMRRRITEDRN